MKKKIIICNLIIGLIYAAVSPAAALAQYGGQPVTQVSFNKTIRNASGGNFVDNLGVNDTRFQAGNEVVYQLHVTNNGNTSFGYVDVTDTLPSYLEFVSGPGNYNGTNRKLTYRIDNLTPGKTDSREIKARVVASNQLPADKGVFCIVNSASATTNTGQTASDTAQACIGAPGLKAPVQELPATGVQELAMVGIFASFIASGFVLRKVS